VIGIALCMAERHRWNQWFTWRADGERYRRRVCTRPGCRHSQTQVMATVRPRSHRRRPGRAWRYALAIETAVMRPKIGPLGVLGGIALGTAWVVFGGVFWHAPGA
jgi:hypothetical protein